MKPASRVQAIIEILTEVLKDKTPSDVILDNYFKQRRYIGSKDRRFISDNVWKIIRNRTKYTQMLENNATPRLLVAINFIEEE
jgi:16S rRNA (cytosine967-C5)-methyltransferase